MKGKSTALDLRRVTESVRHESPGRRDHLHSCPPGGGLRERNEAVGVQQAVAIKPRPTEVVEARRSRRDAPLPAEKRPAWGRTGRRCNHPEKHWLSAPLRKQPSSWRGTRSHNRNPAGWTCSQADRPMPVPCRCDPSRHDPCRRACPETWPTSACLRPSPSSSRRGHGQVCLPTRYWTACPCIASSTPPPPLAGARRTRVARPVVCGDER